MLKSNVPAAVATGLIGLAAGVGIGVAYMSYNKPPEDQKEVIETASPGRGGGGGGGGGGSPPPGTGAGMTGRPSSKGMLAQLVVKLDQLTSTPLAVNLTAEQKKKVKELIAGIGDKDVLPEDQAREKYEALLSLLEGQRETFEAAGYRWPGPGGGRNRPPNFTNPFKDEENAKHLKSLEATVSK
jgi:hypothetical protein